MRDNFDYVLQENMFDCGLAALKTIFLQFGQSFKEDMIRTKSINQGLTALELIELSKKNGINAKGVKATLNSFDFKFLPCIAHTIKDKNYYHYIVILKNRKKSKTLIVMDPAIGVIELSYKEFNDITTNIFIIFDQEKIKKSQDRRFKKLLKTHFISNKKLIIHSLALSILIIFLSLIFNYFLTFILQVNKSHQTIIIISSIFLGISFFKNIIQYFRDKLIVKLNKNIDKKINQEFITHILQLPYQYYETKTIGEQFTLVNDIENVKSIITKIFVLLLIDVVLLSIILIFISFYSIYYLLVLLFLLFVLCFFAKIFQRSFNNSFLKLKKSKINFNSYIIEVFSSFNSFKNLRLEKNLINKAEKIYENYLSNNHDYEKRNNKFQFLNSIVIEIFYILIIVIAIFINLKNNNELLSIVFFSNLFYLFLSFLNNIVDTVATFKVYQSSIIKVLDVFDIKKEEKNNKNLAFKKIMLNNINFSYGDNKILDNLNLEIVRNDKILLYGSSGSGKSTLIKILLKYYEIKSGNIFFDNLNYKYLNSNRIKSCITYVSQEETLFNDTIYKNLEIVNKNKKEINKAMEMCLINIDKNYVLEENATNISGGERKKILIARSLLRNSKMVIFDESFNELDKNSERIIFQNIINNYKDLTIILISHRKNNLFLFNKIYELKDGKLKEEKNERINE